MTGGNSPRPDSGGHSPVSSPEVSAAAAKRRAEDLIGRIIAGRFRIDGVLAMGGMGSVFVAEHVHMRKRVAVKLLHPEMRNLPELVTRFERESVVGGHASHPNVVSASDFGRLDDGSYYLVLEYVDGITLYDLMKRGPVPPERAAEIVRADRPRGSTPCTGSTSSTATSSRGT